MPTQLSRFNAKKKYNDYKVRTRQLWLVLIISVCYLNPIHAYAVNEISNDTSRLSRQTQVMQRAKDMKNSIDSDKNNNASMRKISQISTSTATERNYELKTPVRDLKPPFPDGLNGGRLVTLPPSEHYNQNTNPSGNSFILPPRDIKVWVPAEYDKHPDMKFPVLYCHDGQNAVQDSSSWTGYSWRLAGALTRLAERQLLQTNELCAPPIVVLMPCAEENLAFVPRRHLEYGDISQTFAQSHADFVGLTLKPLIDSKFRTMPEKEHTAVIGTSLGGQASLHLLLRHPEVFGKAACMSPAFQPSILSSVASLPSSTLLDKTIYIDNGGDGDDVKVAFLDPFDHFSKEHWWNPGYWWLDSQLQPGIDAMMLALDLKGVQYEYNKIAGGRHNERAWALRIDKPLLALFGSAK